MLGFSVRPKVFLQTSLKYSVTSSISCRFKSVTMMKISSHRWSCIPRKSISSGSCGRPHLERCGRKEDHREAETHHCEHYWHHRKSPLLHGFMVVDMRSPCSVEWDQAPSVHSPAEDVLWHEDSLVPKKHLALLRSIGDVFSFADSLEPIPIRVVSMLEPFIDEEIRRVAIEGLAD